MENNSLKKDQSIIVFGYAFPHKKTYDFLLILYSLGFKNIYVVAAPKVNLKNTTNVIQNNSNIDSSYCVKNLCFSLGFYFEECPHDNLERISLLTKKMGIKLAIISGARIIKKEVIDVFSDGIINFHPGKIPETSGLNAFYYAIKNNCPMGVTIHQIDHKVDAGNLIFFEKLRIEKDDNIESTKKRLYGTQLYSLRKYLLFYYGNKKNYTKIDRPKKNIQLNNDAINELKSNFMSWKDVQIKKQSLIEEEFFKSCQNGDLRSVKQLLKSDSYLINIKNSQGWSGIIIASFWQHIDLVRYFLGIGVSPNDAGKKGTTVLMYAKTKFIEEEGHNISLIKLLLDNGADIFQKDKFGYDIFHYLQNNGTKERKIKDFLLKFIKKKGIYI